MEEVFQNNSSHIRKSMAVFIRIKNGEKKMAVKLKDIYLGVPDGATEAESKNFEELFYDPNNKYDELMNNEEKFLVIGNKGTGKTYLAKYVLLKAPKKGLKEMVNANDFSIYKLANVSEIGIGKDLMYALCKWYLLDKISKLLLNRHIWKRKVPVMNIYELKKFVTNYDNDSFFKEIKRTDSKNSDGRFGRKSHTKGSPITNEVNCGISIGSSVESERKEFYELITAYEELLFKSISKNDDILLIIDDLDEIEKDKEKAEQIIAALINVTKEYNFKIKKYKGKLKIILLLRSDILNDIQVYNANLSKIKTSCGVELYWLLDSVSNQYEHPLMSMVLHKIKASCPEYRNASNKKIFNEMFPDNIDSKKPLDYLLDYGFGRPRDIITYLNHTKEQYPEENCFSPRALKESRKLYSEDFYNEMQNQASFHKEPEYIKECFLLLQIECKVTFKYEDVKKNFENSRERFRAIDDIADALEFLYEIGAIGNVWKVNGHIHTCWAYKKDAMDKADLNKKFTIHYGLRKKFSY